MEIVERLEERVPPAGDLQRVVLLGPRTGARHLSAVVVRLPPTHELPLHTHPGSEDCFFVLSGSGEALEPGHRHSIASPAGVWIPAGHPHGLRAGDSGMLEVGFQSPADHTALPYRASAGADLPSLLVKPLPAASPAGRWCSAFPERRTWRYLDAEYSVLESAQTVSVCFGQFESALVLASGTIELPRQASRRLSAFSVIRLDPDESLVLRALASPTLLIAVKARPSRESSCNPGRHRPAAPGR
jgi:quercetin dioxygenase-like cupin family protein